MSSYTGLYVQRSSNGKINSVQVVDPHRNSLSLDPESYIQRQLKPPIEQLPDIQNYKAASSEPGISSVVLSPPNWINGENISKKNLYRMQNFGFIHPDQNGHLQMTQSGAQALRDNHIV